MLTRNFRELESVVAYHVKEDKVAQGSYETCHIGCLAKGEDDPDYIKTEYGIPVIITRIQETIFENLEPNEAVKFFASFPSAVACDGKDLTGVGWQFLASELRNLPEVESDIQAVIDPIIKGLDLLAAGKPWPEADVAYYAAFDAAYDSIFALLPSLAFAAAYAVRTAAYDTYYAAFAAVQFTHHVTEAASQADRAATRLRQRDTLLKLISEAPVRGN